MTAVLEVPASRDFNPAVSPDRVGKVIFPDKAPWSTIALGNVPVAVIEQVVQVIEVNDVMGATIGHGESVVVQIDEIRSSLNDILGPALSEIKMQIDFGTCIGVRITRKHSGNSECQQDFFSHMRNYLLLFKADYLIKPSSCSWLGLVERAHHVWKFNKCFSSVLQFLFPSGVSSSTASGWTCLAKGHPGNKLSVKRISSFLSMTSFSCRTVRLQTASAPFF